MKPMQRSQDSAEEKPRRVRPAAVEPADARRPVPAASPEDAEPTLADYLTTLVEGRWLVAAALAAALLVAGAYAVVAPPRYRADVLVQVEEKSASPGALEDLSMLMGGKTPAETEIEILRSRYLIGSVVDQLQLDLVARPRTFPLVGGAFFRRHEGDDVAPPRFGLARFAWGGESLALSRLEVPARLVGEALTLVAGEGGAFELLGPEREKLLDGRVGVAAEQGQVGIYVAALKARPGTEFRLSRLRRSEVVEELQARLRISEKGKKTGVIQVALEGRAPARIATTLDAIATTYLRQNVERKSAEAQKTLDFLEKQLPALKANVDAAELAREQHQKAKGSVDVSLETKAAIDRAVDVEKGMSELQVQLAELRERFTESHPAVATLKQKLAQLQGEKASLEGRLKDLPTAELESARLIRDLKVSTELYVLLLNKSQELRVVKEGTIGNVRILDTAVVPYEPVAPKKARALALALVLGLGGGVALAFAKRALSRGIEDPEALERATGIGVYATIPHSEGEQKHGRHGAVPILAAEAKNDLAVESLRSLRTSLQFALAETASNVVTVLGPAPAVGKSFVATNLAWVVAETGKRVLLVDADMRRGRLHHHFGGARERGLSEVIGGTYTAADAISRTESANLDFLSTGVLPPNPSELLGSERFERLLGELSRTYDLVVIDTPPILAVTDAALVGRLAGVNLLVLRAGKHPAREIVAALKRFDQGGARVTGAVMNDVSTGVGHRKYHYYYSYEDRPKE
jgi:tyrosine-protein kinase Etk/Wzc